MTRYELREYLAHEVHASWSRWMDYLFSKCEYQGDGTMRIPAWAVERWQRQAATPYAALTDTEKESDREEVDAYFWAVEYYALDQQRAAQRAQGQEHEKGAAA